MMSFEDHQHTHFLIKIPSTIGGSNYTNQRSHRSFTDLINSAGNAGDTHHASLLNTDITKEALATLANDSLTNLDLNTGNDSKHLLSRA